MTIQCFVQFESKIVNLHIKFKRKCKYQTALINQKVFDPKICVRYDSYNTTVESIYNIYVRLRENNG